MNREELTKLYVKQMREFKKSEGTIKEYCIKLNDFFNYINKEPISIVRKDVKSYLSYKDELATSTKEIIVSAINSFYKVLDYMEVDGFDEIKNPTDGIILPRKETKEKTPLNREQVEWLLHSCKNVREKALISFLFGTGLRISECINVTLDDYNKCLECGYINVLGKGRKNRKIYLSNDIIEYVNEYLKVRKDGCDNLFTSNNSTPLERISTSRTLKVIARRSGKFTDEQIEHLSPHLMRHSCLTQMSNDGVDTETISRVAGHSSSAITSKIYVHVAQERVEDAMRSMAI